MISIHDQSAVEALQREQRFDRHRLRQLRTDFYKKQRPAAEALARLPAEVREAFASQIEFHALELHSRHDSQLDGASKLIFRTAQHLLLESVILRMTTGRTALCLSTQVGCAARCEFCATGRMGIARNLSVAEILDQVLQANQLLRAEGRAVRNLVFMGMGEPFHNEEALYGALDILSDVRTFHLNLRRVLISTVGIPDAMVRVVTRYPEVRMALSLHSARDDVRRRLMPLAERYSLDELRRALEEVARIGGREVMIEYLMLKDLNDSLQDARALIEYLRDIPVHVNLIPYNAVDDAPHLAGSEPGVREAFSATLKAAGLPVTTRYSLGADIAAACGQLVRQENRALARAASTGLPQSIET